MMTGNWWGISSDEFISGKSTSHHISSSGKIKSGLYTSACGKTVKLNMHASKMEKCKDCLSKLGVETGTGTGTGRKNGQK